MQTVICRAGFVLFLLIPLNLFAETDVLRSSINELEKNIREHETYDNIRENRIKILRERTQSVPKNSIARYDLNQQLYLEYKPYICDSAIVCLGRNIDIAAALGDTYRKYESALMLSSLLSGSGMYKESFDVLALVDRQRLPSYLSSLYYETCGLAYEELAFSTQYPVGALSYWNMSGCYKDSLSMVLPGNSTKNLILRENRLRHSGDFDASLAMNDDRLRAYPSGTAEYALAAFHRALTYRDMGDMDNYKVYLALSAISDISAAINDHASLWMLAEQLYAEGNIEKAYEYIRFSWDKTLKYNARLRNTQSSGLLSIIDDSYQKTIREQNNMLRLYLGLSSVLAALLVFALAFIYRQLRKLSATQKDLRHANALLTELNHRLNQINLDLNSSNNALLESNQIKEEYIGRFIKLCSAYIDKLDAYRRMVYKKITAGQAKELLPMTRSTELIDSTLEELYNNFDKAFLRLFPDFVERFNELLAEDERIVPKKDELLNTELRIYALIRMGIDDSAQIAEFLRYSVNTIYNYRAKVKNRARVSRADFENLVKKIS